ncbi:MAG: ribonuclease III domain-containing protein [Cyanobacteria bacterium J06623_5]
MAQPPNLPSTNLPSTSLPSISLPSEGRPHFLHLRPDDQLSSEQLRSLSPISLAYIGDAVFELYVRSRLLMPSKRIRDYHHQVVTQVNAEQQAHYVDTLFPHLTEDEQDLVRRGRNATTGRHRRASGQDYQKATGLEALIGYLYLSDQPRLCQLLDLLGIRSCQ